MNCRKSFETLRRVLGMTVLIVAMVLSMSACGAKKPESDGTEKTFELIVTYEDGKEESFTVTTTRGNVGDALLDEGIIAGEKKSFGLYITSVNGVELDYKKDGHYWGFYIGDEQAMTGVELTEITDGGVYGLRYE